MWHERDSEQCYKDYRSALHYGDEPDLITAKALGWIPKLLKERSHIIKDIREECCKLICEDCAEGIPTVKNEYGITHRGDPCNAEEIRKKMEGE